MLKITGPALKNGNLQVRIEVPRKVDLDLQMPAGQVTVSGIVGDKNIDLDAGQITISATHTSNYRKVDVSVGVWQVNAQVYGATRAGSSASFASKTQPASIACTPT